MRRIIVRIMKCKKIWPFIAKDTYFGNCEIQGLKLRRIFSPYFELNPHLTPPLFFHFKASLGQVQTTQGQRFTFVLTLAGNVLLGWIMERMRAD